MCRQSSWGTDASNASCGLPPASEAQQTHQIQTPQARQQVLRQIQPLQRLFTTVTNVSRKFWPATHGHRPNQKFFVNVIVRTVILFSPSMDSCVKTAWTGSRETQQDSLPPNNNISGYRSNTLGSDSVQKLLNRLDLPYLTYSTDASSFASHSSTSTRWLTGSCKPYHQIGS